MVHSIWDSLNCSGQLPHSGTQLSTIRDAPFDSAEVVGEPELVDKVSRDLVQYSTFHFVVSSVSSPGHMSLLYCVGFACLYGTERLTCSPGGGGGGRELQEEAEYKPTVQLRWLDSSCSRPKTRHSFTLVDSLAGSPLHA